jgi:hypothetical protein
MLPRFSFFNKKGLGSLFCVVGVLLTKLNYIVQLNPIYRESLYFAGVGIAIAGIAIFSSGLTSRTIKKVLVCPSCLQINNSLARACKKCKLPLVQPGNIKSTQEHN